MAMKLLVYPSLRTRTAPLLQVALALVAFAIAAPAAAQDPLDQPLGGLSWGATHEEVLAQQEEALLDAYRLAIAGENDPLEIDRQRRAADELVDAIRSSYREFPDARTGFEVSVVGDELVGAQGQSMLMSRGDSDTRYFIFEENALRKIVVTFDQAALGYIGFEPFVDRLAGVLGETLDNEWRTDDIGVRHLVRSHWEGERTRVRAEDKTRMFASYALVYADVAWEAPEAVAAPALADTEGRRAIGDVMSRIQAAHAEDQPSNEDVVDQLLGEATEVELQVREVEGDAEAEAEEEEEDAEAAEAAPAPRARPSQPAVEPEPESETVF